jgi:hypothetical protein
MSRSSILPLILALLTAGAAGTRAAAADAPVTVAEPSKVEARAITPEQAAAEARAIPRSVYGPIASKDPAVRAQVKRLYQDRAQLHDDTRARLAALGAELKVETDPDFRWEIDREIAQLKQDLELRSVELGLQIARLNEDAERVAQFTLALDQLTNPDKYRPAPVDPSLQQERLRAMDTNAANGGAR